MNHPVIRFLFAVGICVLVISCQKDLSPGETPETAAQKCRVTEMSNIQWSWQPEDSLSFTRFFYDSIGRVSHLVTFAGDTHRYHYSPTKIVIESPQTHSLSGQPQTDRWTETYGLDANGRTKYLTVDYNGFMVQDSTVFTYDANGYLVRQQVYDFLSQDDYEVTYTYNNGNLTKAVFTPTYNYHPDSIVWKYSDIDASAFVLHYMFSDKYRDITYHSWTGKQSAKLVSESKYYYSWGTTTSKFEYIPGGDGMPVTVRATGTNTASPGQEQKDALFIKYKCD